MVETNNENVAPETAAFHLPQNAVKSFMSFLICQSVGAIIGYFLGLNTEARRWCVDNIFLGTFLTFMSAIVVSFYPSNKLLRVGVWILHATPKAIFSGATGFGGTLPYLVVNFLVIFAVYLVHFKLSDYTTIFPVFFWNILAYALGSLLIPDSFTGTAGISFALLLAAVIVILLNIPSKQLELSLLPALKSQSQMLKQRWRSHVISITTIRILSLIAISAAMKSLDLVNSVTTAVFLKNLPLPSPWHSSIVLSFVIVLINAIKPAALTNLVEYGSIISEAFMIGIPLANVPFDRYTLMVIPLSFSYLTAMCSEEVSTFAWQIVLLWSSFGFGFYCTLYDSDYSDKLSYILVFGLYISLRLSCFIRDQRTESQKKQEIDNKV